MSINWLTDVDPAPGILVLPSAAHSLDEAHAAIELWEHYKRRRLDPAQRLAVEVMMATTVDGLWAARTTGREASRQNGKGDEIEVVELWGLTQRAELILHTIHDAVLLATRAQQRLLSVLQGHPDLRRLVKRTWTGTGQQMIEMTNGGGIWYRTRTGSGARGVDEVDRIVVDEAQHADDEHISAITPTQLASANPQTNAMGSAGIKGKSAWWWSLRKRALAGDTTFGYVGHTAEVLRFGPDGRLQRDPIDPSDRSAWLRANSALAAGRVGWEFFEEQYRVLGPDLFAREHLGVWDPEPLDGSAGAVDLALWSNLAQASGIDSDRQWSAAISADRKWSAIGIAGRRSGGGTHVEWMEHRAGTGWLVDRCVDIWESKHIPIRLHAQGPEAWLIDALTARGVGVVSISSAEYARCCGRFVDAVNAQTVRHPGQRSLDRAIELAEVHTSSAGAVTFVESSPGADISTLKAVVVAFGGVESTAVATPGFVSL